MISSFKIIGIIVTLCSSTLLGLYYSKCIAYRIDNLKQLKKIIILLRGEVKYSLSNIPEALVAISTRTRGEFKGFLINVSVELKKFDGNNFHLIWDSSIEKYLIKTYLKKSDLEKLKQLGETLGYLDKEMQLNTLSLYLEQLEEDINYATQNNQQSQKLYRNLGILGGLLIAIIFI